MTRFQDILDLNQKLNHFNYGLVINGNWNPKRNTTAHDWDLYYRLASPQEFEKRRVGTCWDYTTYEAQYFHDNFPDVQWKAWYIIFNDHADMPTHTYLTFKYRGEIYWFESAFKKYQGVWKARSEADIVNFVMTAMDEHDRQKLGRSLLSLPYYVFNYDATNPKLYGMNCEEFMHMAEDHQVTHVHRPQVQVQKINSMNTNIKEEKNMNEFVEKIDELFENFMDDDITDEEFYNELTECLISEFGSQPVTEGANKDYKKAFKKCKKDIKDSMKSLKNMAKRGNPKDASAVQTSAKNCKDAIAEAQKALDEIPSTIPSTVISFLVVWVVDMLKWLIPTLLTFGLAEIVRRVKLLISGISGIVKGAKGEDAWVDALNQVKQKYALALKLMDQSVDAAVKRYNMNVKKKGGDTSSSKSSNNSEDTSDKSEEVKEGATMTEDKLKLAIYEGAFSGIIGQEDAYKMIQVVEEGVFSNPLKKKVEKIKEIKKMKPKDYDGPEAIKRYVDKHYEELIKCAEILEKEPKELQKNEVKACITMLSSLIGGEFLLIIGAGGVMGSIGLGVTIAGIVFSMIYMIISYCRASNDMKVANDLAKIRRTLKKAAESDIDKDCKNKITDIVTAIDDAETEINARVKVEKESVEMRLKIHEAYMEGQISEDEREALFAKMDEVTA